MVNVTKCNFIKESNELIRLLPTAEFIAIDEEMTGICLPNTRRPPKDHNPSERYQLLKGVPERYTIIQLGVCLFHRNPDTQQCHGNNAARENTGATSNYHGDSPEFIARQFNFYLFPPADNSITREVVLNPSSVAFLNQHNMDFDLWSKHGIPFVTGNTAEKLLKKYITKQEEKNLSKTKSNGTNNLQNSILSHRRRVELRRTEDIDFHARAMASLREWLDAGNPQMHHGHHHHHAGHHQRAVGGQNSTIPPSDQGAATGAPATEGVSFLLPPCNSFMRRALYESIQAEYPTLQLESAGPTHLNQIRVWRLNEEEKKRRAERLLREGWEDLIINQIGVWRVFMAISCACRGIAIPSTSIIFASSVDEIDWEKPQDTINNTKISASNGNHEEEEDFECHEQQLLQRNAAASTCRKLPLVLHNGYMDLMFLLTHFHSHELPTTYEEAKELIRTYFPLIYDTKVISTEFAPSPLWNDCTHLENLFLKVIQENEDMSNQIIVAGQRAHNISNEAGVEDNAHQNDDGNMTAHEAAYDAYMTGSVFIGICHYIMSRECCIDGASDSQNDTWGLLRHLLTAEVDRDVKYLFGRNMLYMMLTMYTIDLEANGKDPLSRGMLPESTFRVSNFDPSVTTRDIVRCLSGLIDSSGRRVNFEIVWVDDTTFLVAASYKTPHPWTPGTTQSNRKQEIDLIVREHGTLVHEALKRDFQQKSIIRFDEHLKLLGKKAANNRLKPSLQRDSDTSMGWASRLGSFIGKYFFLWSTTNDYATADGKGSGKREKIDTGWVQSKRLRRNN